MNESLPNDVVSEFGVSDVVRDEVLLLFCIKVVAPSLLLDVRWSKGGDVGIGDDTTVDIGSTNFPSAINFNIACGILNPYSFCNIISLCLKCISKHLFFFDLICCLTLALEVSLYPHLPQYALVFLLLLFGKQRATISSPFVGLLLILLCILIICILRSRSNLDALTLPLIHLLALKCSRSVSSLIVKFFVLLTFVQINNQPVY